MKVIITNDKIEIYREELDGIDGAGCAEFANWMLAWAIQRCSDSIAKAIEKPGAGSRALCD
jgi:hypothetical protein